MVVSSSFYVMLVPGKVGSDGYNQANYRVDVLSNDALSLYYLPFHFSGCLKIVAGQRCIQIVMSDQKQIQRTDGVAVDEAKPKLKKPRLYRVILINDDYTPMEFVVLILQ